MQSAVGPVLFVEGPALLLVGSELFLSGPELILSGPELSLERLVLHLVGASAVLCCFVKSIP